MDGEQFSAPMKPEAIMYGQANLPTVLSGEFTVPIDVTLALGHPSSA